MRASIVSVLIIVGVLANWVGAKDPDHNELYDGHAAGDHEMNVHDTEESIALEDSSGGNVEDEEEEDEEEGSSGVGDDEASENSGDVVSREMEVEEQVKSPPPEALRLAQTNVEEHETVGDAEDESPPDDNEASEGESPEQVQVESEVPHQPATIGDSSAEDFADEQTLPPAAPPQLIVAAHDDEHVVADPISEVSDNKITGSDQIVSSPVSSAERHDVEAHETLGDAGAESPADGQAGDDNEASVVQPAAIGAYADEQTLPPASPPQLIVAPHDDEAADPNSEVSHNMMKSEPDTHLTETGINNPAHKPDASADADAEKNQVAASQQPSAEDDAALKLAQEKLSKRLEREAKAEQRRREAEERAERVKLEAAAEEERKRKEVVEARTAIDERLQRRKREREALAEAERRAEEEQLKLQQESVMATAHETMRSSRFQKHVTPAAEKVVVSHRVMFPSDKALEMGIKRVSARTDEIESTMRRLMAIAGEAGDDTTLLDSMDEPLPGESSQRSKLQELEERVHRLELRAKDFTGVCERLHFATEQKLALEREKEMNRQHEQDRLFEESKRAHDIANEHRRSELEIERARLDLQLGRRSVIPCVEDWHAAVGGLVLVCIAVGAAAMFCCGGSKKGTAGPPPPRRDVQVRASVNAPPQPIIQPQPVQVNKSRSPPPAPVPQSFEAEIVRAPPTTEGLELRNRVLNRWDHSNSA